MFTTELVEMYRSVIARVGIRGRVGHLCNEAVMKSHVVERM
jgi:hypothetical protein